MLTLALGVTAIKAIAVIFVLMVICRCSQHALEKAPAILNAIAMFKTGSIQIHTQR